jgi:hypothetical protein
MKTFEDVFVLDEDLDGAVKRTWKALAERGFRDLEVADDYSWLTARAKTAGQWRTNIKLSIAFERLEEGRTQLTLISSATANGLLSLARHPADVTIKEAIRVIRAERVGSLTA